MNRRVIEVTAELFEEEEGGFSVYCPELDIYTQGEDLDDAPGPSGGSRTAPHRGGRSREPKTQESGAAGPHVRGACPDFLRSRETNWSTP